MGFSFLFLILTSSLEIVWFLSYERVKYMHMHTIQNKQTYTVKNQYLPPVLCIPDILLKVVPITSSFLYAFSGLFKC